RREHRLSRQAGRPRKGRLRPGLHGPRRRAGALSLGLRAREIHVGRLRDVRFVVLALRLEILGFFPPGGTVFQAQVLELRALREQVVDEAGGVGFVHGGIPVAVGRIIAAVPPRRTCLRLTYPRSFLSLLVIGFSLVAAPLLFALLANAIAF